MTTHLKAYLEKELLGILFEINVIIYVQVEFIFYRIICIFRTVYLVKRKKDSKPFVIKAQDLNAANHSPSEVYNYIISIF